MIIPPSTDRGEGPSTSPSSPHATSYRITRGTRATDIPNSHDTIVPPLSTLNGPFQLAEYLALKIRSDPHDVKALVEVPKGDAATGGKAPERNVWIYEHLRRLPIDLTPLLTSLLHLCSRASCPEMKADQWLYFCSAHAKTEECCAIDYILHTVDSTTALLNSSQQFPSRLSIPSASLSHFPSLFRRLSRIFSHAYFHHREAFSLSESETSLYARFVALCEKYELVGEQLLVIPRDAIGTFGRDNDEDEEGEGDEEEDDEDEDEEDEEDQDEEEVNESRGRGEKESNEKRTRSLDRHHTAASSSGTTINRSPNVIKAPTPTTEIQAHTYSPATTSSNASSSPKDEDPFRSSPRNNRISRGTGAGTLGRGKQPRGTMLWTSDSSQPELPSQSPAQSETSSPFGPELTRTESNQTAVLLAEGSEEGSEVQGAEEGEEGEEEEESIPVPKDEIELLEEEGVIPPAPTVSPLPPPSNDEADSDGMEDVELRDAYGAEREDGGNDIQKDEAKNDGVESEKKIEGALEVTPEGTKQQQ